MSVLGESSSRLGRPRFLIAQRANWESVAVGLLLCMVFVMSLLWAMISQRVPDESVYFAEILDLANSGATVGYSGHAVGVFAWLGAGFVKVFGILGLTPLMSVRVLGALLVTACALLAYWGVSAAMPEWPFARLSAIPFVAFNPMFMFIGSSSNSDTMLNVGCALLFGGAVWFLRDGWSRKAVVAMLVGALIGASTKDRSLVALSIVPLALILRASSYYGSRALTRYASRVKSETPTSFWNRSTNLPEMAGFAILALLLVWGGPKAFSALVYEPIALSVGPFPEFASLSAVRIWLASRGVSWLALTAWADFGYLDVLAPRPLYWMHFALLLSGMTALFIVAVWTVIRFARARRFWELMLRPGVHIVLLSAITVVLSLYFVAQYEIVLLSSSQGRYLFVASVPIAVLLLRGYFGIVPRQFHRVLAVLLTLFMFASNWFCLLYVVAPSYY